MKKLTCFTLFNLFCIAILPSIAQPEKERLDLPGDNLNLYAVLRLFQKSTTPESFEKSLNDKNSEVNNLDLDGDGNVDYIRVYDNVSGKLHTITLKIAVSDSEDQDIAAIFVEKKDGGKVLMQMVGDEELYGKDYIIEPYTQAPPSKKSDNPGYISTGDQPSQSENFGSAEVATWPVVKYIFLPGYNVWRSPWRWHYYPSAWRPWRAQYWHYYYGYHFHWQQYYNYHFRRWKYFRNPAWYGQYNGGNFKTPSIIVRTRKGRGDYRGTYSQPLSAKEGSALFKKKHPKSPGASFNAPTFDRAGRPTGIKRSVEPQPSTVKKRTTSKKKTRGNGGKKSAPASSRGKE